MSFSPFIFLIIYLVLVGIFLIISIINFYHIIRFGFLHWPSLVMTFVYLGLVVLIILFTFKTLGNFDWQEPLEINLPFISQTNEGPE